MSGQCSMCEPPSHRELRAAARSNWVGGGWCGPTDAKVAAPPSGGSSVKLQNLKAKRVRLK